MTERISQRAYVMGIVSSHFKELSIWDKIEPQVAIFCSNIPEVYTEEKKGELIKVLEQLKTFLSEEGIKSDHLSFFDEEIEHHRLTKQISLYIEEDDEVPQEIIKKYATSGYTQEGIVGIHLKYSYKQVRKLTNGVYKETGLIKFYISKEKIFHGKIIAEIYEHPQKIPIATLCHSKKKHDGTTKPLLKYISLFGEKIEKGKYISTKEILSPFYVYRFISDQNRDYMILSTTRLNIGDFIVTGMVCQVDDYRTLTDSSKLPTKLPFIFAHTVKNRIIKFKNHQEFEKKLKHLSINKDRIFNFPFSMKDNSDGKTYVLKHPIWFKWLIWSWLTHAPKGMFNSYPMHLLVVGESGTGKSYMLNVLHKKSKETRDIFSGSQSTLRNLVPSFKYKPAQLGYLAESNRFAFLDEFFRCVTRTRTSNEGNQREETFATMNDLLEHQKREAGSGVSRVNVNMTARAFATSNPFKGKKSMEDLLMTINLSFMSRLLTYIQKDESDHVKMIQNSKKKDLEEYKFKLSSNDWIAILDYLHSFNAEYDDDIIDEIFDSPKSILSTLLRKHYDARHRHHIECLMDGIVKARCLFEMDISFIANKEDYKILEDVWDKIISSWIDANRIKDLPKDKRIRYLPENSQWIYNEISRVKRPSTRLEVQDTALKAMSKREFRDAYIILIDNGLIRETDEMVTPYWLNEEEQVLLSRGR